MSNLKTFAIIGASFAAGAAIAASTAEKTVVKLHDALHDLNSATGMMLELFGELSGCHSDCTELARRINAWIDAYGAQLAEIHSKIETDWKAIDNDIGAKPFVENWKRSLRIIMGSIAPCTSDPDVSAATKRFTSLLPMSVGM